MTEFRETDIFSINDKGGFTEKYRHIVYSDELEETTDRIFAEVQDMELIPVLMSEIERGGAKLGNDLALDDEEHLNIADGAVTSEKLAESVANGYVRAFETVSEMQASTDLASGMICHTNGFHTLDDGGAAFYKITATGTANGMDVLACGDMFANLVITESYVMPEMFGAWGDGTHDDTSYIQYAIDTYPKSVLLENDYHISTGLNIASYGVVEGNGSIYSDEDCFELDHPTHIKICGLRLYPQRHGINITTDNGWVNYNIFEDLFIYGSYSADDPSKQSICGIRLNRTTSYLNEQTFINCVCWNFAYGIWINNPDRSNECAVHRFINCSTELSKISGQYLNNADSILFENCRHTETISNVFTTNGICNHLMIIGGNFYDDANLTTLSDQTNGIILGSFRSAGIYHETTGQIAYIVNGKTVPIADIVTQNRKQLAINTTFPDNKTLYKYITANASGDMTLTLDKNYYGGTGKINELFIRIPANGNQLTIVWDSHNYVLSPTTSEQFIMAKWCNITYSPAWYFVRMQTS